MSVNQNKLDAFLLKSLILLAVGMVVAQSLGQDSLTSYMFLLTFPLTVLLWIRTIRSTVTGLDVLVVVTIGLALINVLINASMTGTGPSFSYIRKMIIFSVTLLFFQTVYRLKISEETVRFINLTADLLVIYLILAYFFLNVQMFQLHGRPSIYLTFHMDNPNLTALFLICLYMLEMYRLFTPERWYSKVLHIIMSAFLALFVVQTQSRNALLVMSIFTVVCAWLVFRGTEKMKMGKLRAALIATFPAVFVSVYVALIYTPAVQKAFDFLVSEGKKLDSRTKIWTAALDHLRSSPIVGAYSQISNGSGSSQMHNTHLDIACSYGIPVLILVCVLLWSYLNQKDREYQDKCGYIYILGFSCAIILGIGEAALFSGGLGLYVLVGCFMLLASHSEGKCETQ